MSRLRLATRGSELALTQSRQVAAAIRAAGGPETEILVVRTAGDRSQDTPLGSAGAVGLFTAEVQQALLDGRADYAVHSFKDLPAQQVPGLVLAAVPERADSRDVLLIRPEAHEAGAGLLPLRAGACIGTAAARRSAFVRALRPDLEVALLRGNVPTRLRRLREGRFDAILLAAAGVGRLQLALDGVVAVELDPAAWPGAPAQGALAVECRADDEETSQCLAVIHDPLSATLVEAERRLLRLLGGGCGLPLGAWASREEDGYLLHAALGPTAERRAAPPLVRACVRRGNPADLPAAAHRVIMEPAGEEVAP